MKLQLILNPCFSFTVEQNHGQAIVIWQLCFSLIYFENFEKNVIIMGRIYYQRKFSSTSYSISTFCQFINFCFFNILINCNKNKNKNLARSNNNLEGIFLCLGNPLLDISGEVGSDFLEKFFFKLGINRFKFFQIWCNFK